MKYLRVAACMLMLVLVGCNDNNEKSPTVAKPDSSVPQTAPVKDKVQLRKLVQQSQGKSLTLLDASEAQLDGAAAFVLTFFVPFAPEQDFSRIVHVVDKKSDKVGGVWELAPNLKELRLCHLEPNRGPMVTIERDLLALNKATFAIDYEKSITTRDVQPSVGFVSRGSLLPGKVIEGLSVMTLNVNSVDVNFSRVKPELLGAFVSQRGYRNPLTNWESDNLLKMAELMYTGRPDLNPMRNTREKLLLSLGDVKPLQ